MWPKAAAAATTIVIFSRVCPLGAGHEEIRNIFHAGPSRQKETTFAVLVLLDEKIENRKNFCHPGSLE
jgi:hypothetical protein